jgi:hypothetical protein
MNGEERAMTSSFIRDSRRAARPFAPRLLAPRALACVATAAALFTFAPPAAAVWPVNPKVNLPVCTFAGRQYTRPAAVPDGSGGMIVTWTDMRNGGNDIYAQHVMAGGYLDPAWPPTGCPVNTMTGTQANPLAVTDGASGALILWEDDRSGSGVWPMYVGRLLARGAMDPAWTAGGKPVSAYNGYQYTKYGATDGAGGMLIAWGEQRGSTDHDIYVQRVTQGGTLPWNAQGVLVCNAAGSQYTPAACSDLAGGAIVFWSDYRKGTNNDYDLYATRVLAGGTLDSRWAANGVAICTLTGTQTQNAILPDGTGGAFLAWGDGRVAPAAVYAQHVRGDGTIDPAWPANGRLVNSGGSSTPLLIGDGSGGFLLCSIDSLYYVHHVLANGTLDPAWPAGGVHLPPLLYDVPALVPDGAGGALVLIEDFRVDNIYGNLTAFRVRSNGVLDPAWPAGGLPVSTAAAEQAYPAAVSDGSSGAVVAWIDGRTFATTDYDVYAQRVRSNGVLGVPEPHITWARDVRGDQGGKLLLAWSASEGDGVPNGYVSRYLLWRKIDASAAAARIAQCHLAAGLVPNGALAAAPAGSAPPLAGDVREAVDATGSTWWEFIATVPASQQPYYAYTVPTTADSLPGWIPWNVFVVDAEDNTAWAFYSSAADSGYSADNIAPHFPAPCFGQYTQGMALLWWQVSHEPDFAVYRLYRDVRNDFIPGPETLVATLRDTTYLDYAGSPYYYMLQSVDVHGNASPNALIVPDGALDAGGPPPPRALAFHGAHPNPAHGRATLAFDLPATADVRLTIFDLNGRRVRELSWDQLPAGIHTRAWDGRDAEGLAVAPGLYLARFEALGCVKNARFALIR